MTKVLEQEIGISGDYQYASYHCSNYAHANWHKNKFYALGQLLTGFSGGRALDIGAGSGLFEYLFHDRFDSITAIDYNEDAVEFVNNLCNKYALNNVQTKLVNIDDLSFIDTDIKYDLIVILDVIEHLKEDTVNNLMKTVKASLSSNGVIVVTTPNYGGVWRLTETIVDNLGVVPKLENVQHVNKFNVNKLVGCFKSNGFKIKGVTTINTLSYLMPFNSISRRLVEWELGIKFPYGNLILAEFSF